jgi:hypothetical protein
MNKLLMALLLMTAVTGCGGRDPSPGTTIHTAPTTTQPPEDASETTEPSAIPSRLVGTWSTNGGDAELVYRFSADGTYRFVGVILQREANGNFEFTTQEIGTATVDGSTMTLQPERGTITRKNPDSPSENYERPVSTKPKRLDWSIDDTSGREILTTVDESGVRLTFDRQ